MIVVLYQVNIFQLYNEETNLLFNDMIFIFNSYYSGLTKPGEVGDFFALVSVKSPNFCQKVKF